MNFPSAREWLFSAKTFAASMIGLYIGLWLQLPHPYWVMVTVYIVYNPFVGATRSKALYRALGTMIGTAGTLLIVLPFVESPFIFSTVVALWTGTLLYLSMFDRSARRYVFLLAGYTLPLIALPTVTNPAGVVRSRALAHRGDSGRHCGGERGRLSGAAKPSRADADRAHRRLVRDAAFYASETLSGHLSGKTMSRRHASALPRPSTRSN